MDKDTVQEMEERVEQFLGAMKTPTKRMGEGRIPKDPNYKVHSPPEPVKRFEQLNREEPGSSTTFGEGGGDIPKHSSSGGHARVHVGDYEESTK